MAQIIDDVSYLAEEIGPRPAGTEEEQQAALYIAERLHKDAGFQADVEDFKCVPDYPLVRIVCFAVALVAALVAFLFNVAAIPAIIVGLIVAVLYALELFDKPVVSRLLARGISQNVVARYEAPQQGSTSRRRRKVVLVAHYDSGRSMPLMRGPVLAALPILQKGTRIAVLAVPILLLIRQLAFANSAGVLPLLFNVVIIVGMAFILLATAWEAIGRLQQYNDAANNNASGVAVLLETARRIAAGSTNAHDASGEDVTVHGEEEARSRNLVPEGAELVYETEVSGSVQDSPQEDAQRLAAAKAAIAALTGTSVAAAPVADISENLAKVEQPLPEETEELRHEQNMEILNAFSGTGNKAEEPDLGDGDVSKEAASSDSAQPAVSQSAVVEQQDEAAEANRQTNVPDMSSAYSTNISSHYEESNVPDWYKKAQQRAKKQPQTQPETAFRSRYAAALDATEAKLHEQDVELQEERERQEAAARHEAYLRELEQRRAVEAAMKQQQAAAAAASEQKPDVSRETSGDERVIANEEQQKTTAPVSRETQAPAEVERTTPATTANADVSRETTVIEQRPFKVVSNDEPSEDETAKRAQSNEKAGEAQAVPADSTTAMAPIDVSDLLEEMKSYKTIEPEVPAFITGEHERIVVQAEQTESTPEQVKVEPVDESKERLIDPDAPFVPMSADRTVQMSPVEIKAGLDAEQTRRAHVVLPDLPDPEVAPIAEVTKQRAPLADVTDNKAKKAARSLLSTVLPEVGGSSENAAAKNSAAKHNLADLPSLSGELRSLNQPANEAEKPEHTTVSATGSFATVGATGSFAPVGDELVADVAPDDLYVQDADDSDYAENFTETGAFAGPGYVEMPKSRMQKLFGRFGFGRKKKHEEEMSAHEWLDVDDDFEAQSVGKQRGSWESFRTPDGDDGYASNTFQGSHTGDTGDFTPANTAYTDEYSPVYADGSDYYGTDEYGYSEQAAPLPANSPLRRGNTFQDANVSGEYGDFEDDDFGKNSGRWNGGAVSSDRAGAEGQDQTEIAATSDADSHLDEEIEKIYEFRNPDIDFDVWFVALGSTVGNNEGMRQFIAEHEHELKHAVVINLESLGAGELMFVNKEGCLKKRTVSSRMKRCIKKASQATGVSCGTREIGWRESPATLAMAHKLQGMTLSGMDGLKPAGYAEQGDVVGSVREEKLRANADFVFSMLKNI